MGTKKLWHFCVEYRGGKLESLFIATEEEVKKVIGKQIYFGEVLGKHSEIVRTIQEFDIQMVDVKQETIFELEQLLGSTLTGHNPLDHYDDDDEEEEE